MPGSVWPAVPEGPGTECSDRTVNWEQDRLGRVAGLSGVQVIQHINNTERKWV